MMNTAERGWELPGMGLLGSVLVCILVATYLCHTVYGPALYGQIVLGNWVLAHGAAPRLDIWTEAGRQAPAVFPSWLFGVVLSLLESSGPAAFLTLELLLFAAFTGACAFAFAGQSGNRFFGVLLAALVSAGALVAQGLEPRLAGMVLFISSFTGAFLVRSNAAAGAAGAVLGALYANTDSSAAGCFLFLAALKLADRKSQQPSTLFIVFFGAGQCLSPYFGMQAVESLRAGFVSLKFAYSLQSSPGTIFHYPVAFLTLVWVLLGYFWHCSPRRAAGRDIVACLLLSAAALGSVSLIPFALFVTGFFCARARGSLSPEQLGNLGIAFDGLRRSCLSLPAAGALFVVLSLIIVNVRNLYRVPMSGAGLPRAEMDFFLEQGMKFPLFHDSAIGPYIVYRLSNGQGEPRARAAWSAGFLSNTESLAFEPLLPCLKAGWEQVFERFHPLTVLCVSETPLCRLLRYDSRWQLREPPGDRGSGPRWVLFESSGRRD